MKITINASAVIGRCDRFWTGMCNPCIEMRDGRRLFELLKDVGITHYRTGLWRESSDWDADDRIAEDILACGAKLIVIVSVPGNLGPVRKEDRLPRRRGSGPTDYAMWREYVYRVVEHGRSRFGEEEIENWYWECTNEPAGPGGLDIDTYCRIYDHFAEGALRAHPRIRIGGPNVSTRAWLRFTTSFFTHCAEETNYANGSTGTRLDFVAFHSYGGHPGVEKPSPQLETITSYVREISKLMSCYPGMQECRVLVDEWGVSWGGWMKREGGQAGYEGGKLGFETWMGPLPWLQHRDNEYSAAFVCKLVDELFFLKDHFDYVRADILAFCPTGNARAGDCRDFDGTRTLFTDYSQFRKPLVNAYEALNRLGDERLPVTSEFPGRTVSALATRAGDRSVRVMVTNFDGRLDVPSADAAVSLVLKDLPFGTDRVRVEHYRIDKHHSNAHTEWLKQGCPERPNSEQAAAIRAGERLEMLEPPRICKLTGGKLTMDVFLPSCGVSLVVLEPG